LAITSGSRDDSSSGRVRNGSADDFWRGTRREVLSVADAAGFPLDAHDPAIESLGHAVGDRVRDTSKYRVEVSLERGRDGLDRIEPRADGPAVPVSFIAAGWR